MKEYCEKCERIVNKTDLNAYYLVCDDCVK